MRPSLAVSILFAAVTCFAQVSSPKPNGTVTGRVFCGDTGRPARFATVFLLNKVNFGSASEPTRGVTMVTTTVHTALDGGYTIAHVSPGTYYVIVNKDGYITPLTMFSQKQLEDPTEQTRALAEKVLPSVRVEQNSTAHADVQLQRGAVVSGTISYDDGTPATGIGVNLRYRNEDGNWVYRLGSDPAEDAGLRPVTTDDRGYFRITSLLPDTYILEATLKLEEEKGVFTRDSQGRMSGYSTKDSQSSIIFYDDGTPYIERATSFTLRGSDERTGQNMTLPISKLHTLTGRVVADSDGHAVNAASVELLYASEGSGKTSIARTVIERDDGLFHFKFVPSGDYTLRVTNARDASWVPREPSEVRETILGDMEHVLDTYGDADMPLLLRSDMTDVIATVPARRTNQSATK